MQASRMMILRIELRVDAYTWQLRAERWTIRHFWILMLFCRIPVCMVRHLSLRQVMTHSIYWKSRNKIDPRTAAVDRCSHLSSPNNGLLNTNQANLANICQHWNRRIPLIQKWSNACKAPDGLKIFTPQQQQTTTMTHHFTALSQESSMVGAIPWMNRQAGPIRDSRGGSGAQGDHRDPTTSYS